MKHPFESVLTKWAEDWVAILPAERNVDHETEYASGYVKLRVRDKTTKGNWRIFFLHVAEDDAADHRDILFERLSELTPDMLMPRSPDTRHFRLTTRGPVAFDPRL